MDHTRTQDVIMQIASNATSTLSSSNIIRPKLTSERMPLGGLALPLAEMRRKGILKTLYLSTLSHITWPPEIDLGLDFRPPSGETRLVPLRFVFGRRIPGVTLRQARDLHERVVTFRDLVPLLPTMDLPGTWEDWVYHEHYVRLMQHLSDGRIEIPHPSGRRQWPYAKRTPLLHRITRIHGPVTPDHVRDFAVGFPGMAEALEVALPWEGCRSKRSLPDLVANTAASQILGIPVDLRIGSLVSKDDVDHAVRLAGGSIPEGVPEDEAERLRSFIDLLVPRIKDDNGLCVPGSSKAAWSCMVDAVLNHPIVWTTDRRDRLVDAEEVPSFRTPAGRSRWLGSIMGGNSLH